MFSKGHFIFLSVQLLQDGGGHERPVDSMIVGHCFTSLAVKQVPWSEAMLHVITCQWIRHSVKSMDGGFGRSIIAGKANL